MNLLRRINTSESSSYDTFLFNLKPSLSKKPSENSGFHPFCEEKSPDSSTSHPMKNARRTDRLDDP